MRRTAAGVLAGALALSGAVAVGTPAFAAPTFSLERIQGNDRYETSANIAAAFGNATNIILASGESGRTPDALAANFLAGVRNAPVLLTRRDTTPEPILTRLNALRAAGATRITVVGGPVAVADSQLVALRALGFTVDRVAGANRYETAAAVAVEGETGEAQEASNIGIIASGVSTIDALAGGPLSFKGRHPLFLVTRDDAPGATIAALKATGVTSVFILGGEAVVGPRVVAELTAAGITVRERLAGADRSATSVAIANRLIADFGFSASTFNLASGANEGIDALGGAALSGKENRVLLITNTAASAAPVTAFATARVATLNTVGRIFGGIAAVTAALETSIESAGGGTATGTATTRPELRSAAIVSTTTVGQANATTIAGTVVSFTFDEPVLSANAGDFRLVGSNGTSTATGTAIASISGSTVNVRFGTVNATTDTDALGGNGAAGNVNNYTLATNLSGAATDAQGQSATEGDAAIGTAASTTTTAAANTTTAPDLRSVSGFRQANPAVSATSTAIDFTFDQAAFLTATGDNPGSFNLVLLDGTVLPCTAPATGTTNAGAGTVAGGNGTTTITVICANPSGRTESITAAEVARAYVVEGSVAASQANATATPIVNDNPLQSAAVSNNGQTTTVDLLSAQFVGRNTTGNATDNDQVVFTFDQAAPDPTNAEFRVFFANGDSATGTVGTRSSDNTRVLVNFVGSQLTDAVGASVGNNSGGSASVTIRPASVGVAPVRAGTSGRTPGQVDAPELRSVALSTTTNALGVVNTTATYTFDQAINPGSIQPTSFVLYNANGNRLVGQTCTPPTNATSTNTQVVCTAFTGANVGTSTAQETAAAATVGAVLPGAVAGATGSGNTNTNPAGAEITTGGTGTRA